MHLAGKSESLIFLIWRARHFVWLKGNISVPLKQLYFQMLEWMMMGAFRHVIVQALCAWCHTQTHPCCIQDTHRGDSWMFCQTRLWHLGTRSAVKMGTLGICPVTATPCSVLILTVQLRGRCLPSFWQAKTFSFSGAATKIEICELKDTWKMLIFLEIVFPTAEKKLSEWWFIPNWL